MKSFSRSELPAAVRTLIVRQLGKALADRWRSEKEKPQAATCGGGNVIAVGAATYDSESITS
jgi:hypothetical protein